MKRILLITLLFFITLFCILPVSCSSPVTTEPVNVSETDEDKSEDIEYRLFKKSAYNPKDILTSSLVYEYKNGILIKIKQYDESDNLLAEYIHKYNENGYLIKIITDFPGLPGFYTTFEYDDGKLVRENGFIAKTDTLFSYAICEYDDDNVYLIKSTIYSVISNKESLIYCYTYEYDDEGLLIKEFRYDSSDNLFRYFIYIYDEIENLSRKDSYEEDGTLHGYSIYEYEEIP